MNEDDFEIEVPNTNQEDGDWMEEVWEDWDKVINHEEA